MTNLEYLKSMPAPVQKEFLCGLFAECSVCPFGEQGQDNYNGNCVWEWFMRESDMGDSLTKAVQRIKNGIVNPVRCIDCKHGYSIDCGDAEGYVRCTRGETEELHLPDWYCADGEKP